MKARILTLLFSILFIVGCEKQEVEQSTTKQEIVLQTDTTLQNSFVLEEQKLQTKGSRSGVTPNGLYYRGSNSFNYYLISSVGKHEFLSKRVDSITFVKVSPGTGLLVPANIEIANYDMTIFYDDNTFEIKANIAVFSTSTFIKFYSNICNTYTTT